MIWLIAEFLFIFSCEGAAQHLHLCLRLSVCGETWISSCFLEIPRPHRRACYFMITITKKPSLKLILSWKSWSYETKLSKRFHPRKFYHNLKILNIGKISFSRVLFRQQSIISHGNQGGSRPEVSRVSSSNKLNTHPFTINSWCKLMFLGINYNNSFIPIHEENQAHELWRCLTYFRCTRCWRYSIMGWCWISIIQLLGSITRGLMSAEWGMALGALCRLARLHPGAGLCNQECYLSSSLGQCRP